MSIVTRPGPDGRLFTHSLMAHAVGPPAEHFTDAILDLERLSTTPGLPMVSAWEANDGSWGIEVSLLSENAEPTMAEVASIEGTLAEVLASVRA